MASLSSRLATTASGIPQRSTKRRLKFTIAPAASTTRIASAVASIVAFSSAIDCRELVLGALALGHVERDADHAPDRPVGAAQGLDVRLERPVLPGRLVRDRLARQRPPVRGDRLEVRVGRPEVGEEAHPAHVAGLLVQRARARAHGVREPQLRVRRPEDPRHLRAGSPRAPPAQGSAAAPSRTCVRRPSSRLCFAGVAAGVQGLRPDRRQQVGLRRSRSRCGIPLAAVVVDLDRLEGLDVLDEELDRLLPDLAARSASRRPFSE